MTSIHFQITQFSYKENLYTHICFLFFTRQTDPIFQVQQSFSIYKYGSYDRDGGSVMIYNI